MSYVHILFIQAMIARNGVWWNKAYSTATVTMTGARVAASVRFE